MDIKNLIVKEYLASLKEKNELNYIFPILLESMGFTILTKPAEYVGLQEYGKDIVAVGADTDGIRKKFYFELKGGQDRDITEGNFYGKDGIHTSIVEASYKTFTSAFPEFDSLPLKIVIVHNGIVKGNVQTVLEEFLVKSQANLINTTFDRWDISRLTQLFSEHLFGPYLLTDPKITRLFNRVLVNLNVTDGISSDFVELLDTLFSGQSWGANTQLNREKKLFFETVRLVGFVVYSESKAYENLEIAKRYLTHLVIKFWHWILKNKFEKTKSITTFFDQVLILYLGCLGEYFAKTLPIAALKDGLFSENAGRYEQIGYTKRAFEYLEYLNFFIMVERSITGKAKDHEMSNHLVAVINGNDVTFRPLLDIHSLAIVSTVNLFIEFDKLESAKNYLRAIIDVVIYSKEKLDFLPDTNNNINSVIKLTVSGVKPVYYSDDSSPLITVLFEFLAILDMEDEYLALRDFVAKHEIELGIFVPFHGKTSTSKHLIKNTDDDMEELLFSRSFYEGYQSQLLLTKDLRIPLGFTDFKAKIYDRRTEFEYDYRTEEAGYSYMLDLAHIYFLTPFFPDRWRKWVKQQ